MRFLAADANGVLNDHVTSEQEASLKRTFPDHAQSYEVWCLPLSSLLAAINQSRIDYLALDVEGSQMDILQGLPWATLQFGVIQVLDFIFSYVDIAQKYSLIVWNNKAMYITVVAVKFRLNM